MADCQFCGTLRLNGMAVRKTSDGWIPAHDPSPVDSAVRFACRSCAKEKVNE